jgi:N-acetyl-anhydromuramyl-L-alanine amidase AmpD
LRFETPEAPTHPSDDETPARSDLIMALKSTASSEARRRPSRARDWLWILPLIAMAAALVGCGHRRQSMRPVYVGPSATLGRPCTNCGPGAGATDSTVVEESDLAPIGPSGSTPSTVEEGPLDVPAPSSSVVPRLPRSSGTRSSEVESTPSVDEKAPSASIDDEPAYDPAPTTRSRSGKPSAKPESSEAMPPLTPPTAGKAPRSSRGLTDGRSARASVESGSTSRVRRTSLNADLRPFLDNATASELIFPARADRPWKYIVLHHSAHAKGSYETIDREHRKVLGYEGCGYHFVIGNGTESGDGEIQVAQRWINQKSGVHCRNAKSADVDEYGIGICLVGDFEQDPPTARQIAATRALVAYLSGRYKIAEPKIETHAHLAATPTVCPGKYFPTDSILADPEARPSTAGVERRQTVPTSWRAVRRAKSTR